MSQNLNSHSSTCTQCSHGSQHVPSLPNFGSFSRFVPPISRSTSESGLQPRSSSCETKHISPDKQLGLQSTSACCAECFSLLCAVQWRPTAQQGLQGARSHAQCHSDAKTTWAILWLRGDASRENPWPRHHIGTRQNLTGVDVVRPNLQIRKLGPTSKRAETGTSTELSLWREGTGPCPPSLASQPRLGHCEKSTLRFS